MGYRWAGIALAGLLIVSITAIRQPLSVYALGGAMQQLIDAGDYNIYVVGTREADSVGAFSADAGKKFLIVDTMFQNKDTQPKSFNLLGFKVKDEQIFDLKKYR